MNKITPADILIRRNDRARQSAERRLAAPITPGFEALVFTGVARDRGHLRTDIHPQEREPLPRVCPSRRYATRRTSSSAIC